MDTQTKFTPGPWMVNPTFPADIHAVEGMKSLGVTVRAGDTLKGEIDDNAAADDTECEANARLMATAPEMLGILQDILSDFEQLDSGDLTHGDFIDSVEPYLASIKAVIAKALNA